MEERKSAVCLLAPHEREGEGEGGKRGEERSGLWRLLGMGWAAVVR